MEVAGRTVVITGAPSGIGSPLLELLPITSAAPVRPRPAGAEAPSSCR